MARPIIVAQGSQFLQREGLEEFPAPWEDGLRTDAGPGSFEWWYFDSRFEDGSSAVVVWMTKPIFKRRGPLAPAVILTITRPDGTRLSKMHHFPGAQFSAARDTCCVQIGPNRVQGDLKAYQLHAEVGGMSADLTLTGVVPAWRPGAGKTYYDPGLKHYFGWLAAVPHGHVQGTLTYDGQTTQVQGAGYHDHNWGNIGLEGVLSHWFWGRAHLGDYTTIFVELVYNARYGHQKSHLFFLAQGDRILVGDGRPLLLHERDFQRHPGGHPYPNEIDFHWHAAPDRAQIALRNPHIIDADSLLSPLPAWQQRIARLAANPYYFRFSADMVLDIELGGITARERGQALYELMLLR